LEHRAVVFAVVLLLSGAAGARANEVVRWNEVVTGAAEAAQIDPLTESRWFAILHLAIHDAVNAVEPRYASYRPHSVSGEGASVDAAIAAAAHETMVALFPKAEPAFAAALAESLVRVPDGEAKRRGVELGRTVARDLLAERADDGADRTVAYTAGTMPGEYRPTPPDLTPAFMTQWGGIRPFGLESAAQFRPAPPPAPGSAEAAAQIAVVRAVGGNGKTERSDEQTEIAKFWFENSTQGWNRIARVLARQRKLDTAQSARLLALVNAAMADGFIAGFEAKYYYKYWRPVTAIQAGGETEWLSHLWTPPVPDHPSTHTVLGAAAAAALADFFGTDLIEFATTSGAPYPGITRRFYGFSDAARENGASRVFAGIHFPDAVREGYRQGEQVGHFVCERLLRPVGSQPDEAMVAAAASH
jgi:hypothetical protein